MPYETEMRRSYQDLSKWQIHDNKKKNDCCSFKQLPLGLVYKAAVDSQNEIDGLKTVPSASQKHSEIFHSLRRFTEESSTQERWPVSNTLIVPISRYVLMYKFSEPLGRVGEELKGAGEENKKYNNQV